MGRCVFVICLILLMPINSWAYKVYADYQGLSPQEVMDQASFMAMDQWKSFGATNDVYWVLIDDIEIVNNEQFWVYQGNSAIDHMEVYKVSPNTLPEKLYHVGDVVPFDQRPIKHRAFLLPFNLEKHDQLLLKFWGETPLALRLQTGSASKIFMDLSSNDSLVRIVFGVMLALLIYNLIMFVVTRLTDYMWYTIYMGGVILFVTFLNGMGFMYLWPGSPMLQNSIAFLFICMFQFGAFGFTRKFLNLKEVSKRFDQFYKYASFVPLLMLIAIFVNKGIALKIVSLTTLTLFIVVPIAITLTAIRKSKSVLIFLVAWMFMVVGMLIINLTINGSLPLTFFNIHALEFGVAIESILLSFALAYRIRNKQEQSKLQLQHANRQITEAFELAQKSNHAKDVFLSSVSHELKTPLHALIGNVQLLNLNIDHSHERHKKLVKSTDKAASNLFLHIDKLLIYSEIIAGDMKKIESSIKLTQEVEIAHKHWALLNSNEELNLEFEIDKPLPENVKMDWVHCNKIILITLENAFNNQQQGLVKVYLKHSEKNLNFLITGQGEFKESNSLKWLNVESIPEHWSELGFGFYLCHMMADLTGATIGFAQHEAFWEFSIENPMQVELSEPVEERVSFEGKRILIVDDIIVNLKLMEALVKALGATPVMVDRGQKAIDALNEQSFDLILMDCQMPELSGQQTTQLIRNSKTSYSDIPIIAVTANSQDQDRISCTQSGMDDFIAKPIRLPALSNALTQWI